MVLFVPIIENTQTERYLILIAGHVISHSAPSNREHVPAVGFRRGIVSFICPTRSVLSHSNRSAGRPRRDPRTRGRKPITSGGFLSLRRYRFYSYFFPPKLYNTVTLCYRNVKNRSSHVFILRNSILLGQHVGHPIPFDWNMREKEQKRIYLYI